MVDQPVPEGGYRGKDGKEIILNDKIPLRIFLADNSSKTILADNDTLAKDVVATIAGKLNLKHPERDAAYFSLYESADGSIVDHPVHGDAPVLDAQSNCAKLVFMLKIFTASALSSPDPKMQHLLYIQAVHNVITTSYKCSDELVIALAALRLQVQFGAHNTRVHKPGFLTDQLMEYVPISALGHLRPANWEDNIFSEHKALGNMSARQAKAKFLERSEFYA